MAAIENHTGQFLRELPFFSNLPDADLAAFIKAAVLRSYGKQQRLFLHGDKADRFFVMISGWVKIHRETPEGEEAVVALFTRGDVFGEAAIFGGADYPFSAEAAEETRVVEISAAVLKTMAQNNPEIMRRVMDSMYREIRHLQIESEHLALMSAPQRVSCLTLKLSADMIGGGGIFTFPYDKSLAAARLGMKPETFSRAFAQLKPVGVTVRGTEIRIDSFDRLAEFSCSHCSAQPGDCKVSRAFSRGESIAAGKKCKAAS
jgi:CRP-like cAMP-binding protein